MLETIALKRLGLICTNKTNTGETTPEYLIDFYTLKLELLNLGVSVENGSAFQAMTKERMARILQGVRELRGADVDYVPLFANFPNERPNDCEYLVRRLIGFLGWNTFDMKEFGHDPITQMANNTLWAKVAVAQQLKLDDKKSKWITLTVKTQEEIYEALETWVKSKIYSPVVVQEVLWDDINYCRSRIGINLFPEKIKCKETLARIGIEQFTKFNKIIGKTPTDALRLFAALKGQDVSLAENVSFSGLKLSKPQRRELMIFLNNCSNLEEDLLRYSPLWKAMAGYLHPTDWKSVAPKAVVAFKNLKDGKIRSFESKWKNASDADKLKIIHKRPGTFLRNLTALLKVCDREVVAGYLVKADLSSVPLPLLLTVYGILDNKAEGLTNADRLFIVKSGKFWVQHNNKPLETLALEAVEDRWQYVPARAVIKGELLRRLKEEPTPEIEEAIDATVEPEQPTAVISPVVNDIVLPLQVRKLSDGMLNLAPGSAIDIDVDTTVLRFHCYWKQTQRRTDLDHSMIYVDENMKTLGSISWNGYGSRQWLLHSGDIQSAPQGAVEFIDLILKDIPDKVHYLLGQVLVFAGEEFDALDTCYYGWQERMFTDKNVKLYDGSNVGNNFVGTGKGKNWIPVIYDVKRRKIIIVDLFGNGSKIIQNNTHLPAMIGAMSNLRRVKPTYGQLLKLYCEANDIQMLDKGSEVLENTKTFDMNNVGEFSNKLLTL